MPVTYKNRKEVLYDIFSILRSCGSRWLILKERIFGIDRMCYRGGMEEWEA